MRNVLCPRNLPKWYYICQQLNSQPTTTTSSPPTEPRALSPQKDFHCMYSFSPFVSLFASHLQDHQARPEIIHLLRAPPILQTHPMTRPTPKHWQPNHHHHHHQPFRIKRPRESFREIKSSSPLGHEKSLTGGCSACSTPSTTPPPNNHPNSSKKTPACFAPLSPVAIAVRIGHTETITCATTTTRKV